MHNLFVRILLVCLLSGSMLAQPMKTGDRPVMGFSAESARGQRDLEAKFDSSLNADNLRAWMKRLSARPHHVGSPYGKENAEFIAAQFRSWGFETEIERFDVLFPTPKTRIVEMTAPVKFRAKLNEPALRQDASTGQQTEQLPTYNAYSVDGDVTAPLVYVNYGVPADYDTLEPAGSTFAARSSSPAMAARGAASSRRWRPSTAPSAALSTLIPGTTAITRATFTRKAHTAARTAFSAARWRTCRYSRAIRLPREGHRQKTRNAWR